jgi:hypothetical protein
VADKPPRGRLRGLGESREARAIGLSLLFLTAGFLVVWLTKSVVGIDGDVIFVSLLLIPVLVYLVLSGRLEELRGPGGLEARFTRVAQESVTIAKQAIAPSIQAMDMVRKAGLEELTRLRAEIDESRPTVMTIELGRGHYTSDAVTGYLDFLSQFRNFKFVVFLDQAGSFVAYMPQWAVRGMLSKPELKSGFIDAINRNARDDLRRYPGLIQDAISSDATNAEALREMERLNLEALLVVDGNTPRGVVEREQILSRMMLALT